MDARRGSSLRLIQAVKIAGGGPISRIRGVRANVFLVAGERR
jgi:hypothetical protein